MDIILARELHFHPRFRFFTIPINSRDNGQIKLGKEQADKESRILSQLDEAFEKTLADLGRNQNHEGMLKIAGSLDE